MRLKERDSREGIGRVTKRRGKGERMAEKG
jgi:hypothetical protein